MTSANPLRTSPLDAQHREQGARMAPFAGYEMPIQYGGIVEEVRAVREQAGLFDVSHMGRLFVSGSDAARLLRRVHTYNVQRIAVDSGHYSVLCDEAGGILDDPYVYHLGEERWLMIPNASRNEEDIDWLRRHVQPDMQARLDDRRDTTIMLALQGPAAARRLGEVLIPAIPERLDRRRSTEIELYGAKAFISRTGYTGEDGFEIICGIDAGRHLWNRLIAAGVTPCGLGARDVLRLEAALTLYGNDIDTSTNPFEAGLGWVVSLKDEDFTGRAALLNLRGSVSRRLVCIQGSGRAVFRHGYPLFHAGEPAGVLTSGSFSPTLNTGIGMGYLPLELAAEGAAITVAIRDRPTPARVVPRPFVPHHG